MTLLETLHESATPSPSSIGGGDGSARFCSAVTAFCEASLESVCQCIGCGARSATVEPVWLLPLDLVAQEGSGIMGGTSKRRRKRRWYKPWSWGRSSTPKHGKSDSVETVHESSSQSVTLNTTLEACFSSFFASESLTGEDKYECDTCKSKQVSRI